MATPRFVWFAAIVAAVCADADAQAQSRLVGRDAHVSAGIGVGDGLGVVLAAASPVADVFTRDAALYATYRSDEGSGRLVGSVGLGVGLRLLRIASIARPRGLPTGDLDVGVRVGPSFSVALGAQSDARRARAFSVFADPFVRASRRVRGVDAFAELGAHGPRLRVGVSARLVPPGRR